MDGITYRNNRRFVCPLAPITRNFHANIRSLSQSTNYTNAGMTPAQLRPGTQQRARYARGYAKQAGI